MQFNYGICDKPVCEYCDLVKQATAGAVEPPVAATAKDLKAGLDDLENKMQTASLQEIGERADGDYNLAKNLGTRIDAAVSGLVHGVSVLGIVAAPPATIPDGSTYIVAAAPTGTFAGHANEVATFTGGKWAFQAAHDNETHLVETDNMMWTWASIATPPAWVKVGSVSTTEKVNDAIHKATAKVTPADNDELALADSATTPTPFGLAKLTWGGLKKALWGSIPSLTDEGAAANIPDGAEFPIWDTDGSAPYRATFTAIRDKIWAWLSAAPANTPVADADKLLTIGGNTSSRLQTTVADLKTFLAAVFPRFQVGHTPVIGNLLRYTSTGWDSVSTAALKLVQVKDGQTFHNEEMLQYELASTQWVGIDKTDVLKDATNAAPDGTPMDADLFPFTDGVTKAVHKVTVAKLKNVLGSTYRRRKNGQSLGEDGSVFDISDFSGTPSLIRYRGWNAATAADNARPSLVIKTATGGATYIDMQTAMPFRRIVSQWGTGGSADNDYANGYSNRFYLIDCVDNNYAVKGNNNSYFDVSVFVQSGYTFVEWTTKYHSGSGGMIMAAGFGSGTTSGNITHIGIKWDTQGSGAYRNTMGDIDITVE